MLGKISIHFSRSAKHVLLTLPVVALLAFSLAGSHFAQASAPQVREKVFVIKGLLNVFSQGMVTLGETLDNNNIDNVVFNHVRWRSYVKELLDTDEARRPTHVFIVGHSFGANAALLMARELEKQDVEVEYLVTFDGNAPLPAPSNIKHVTNFWFKGRTVGQPVVAGPGFSGRLENIDLSKVESYGHLNVEKQPALHQIVVQNILAVLKQASEPVETLPQPSNL